MTYRCPHCGFRIALSDRHCGETRACPACLRDSRVPDALHRDRLEALFEQSNQRPLTAAEWNEVATHYRALGDRAKADKAEISASRAFDAESERRVDAIVPDLVAPVEAAEIESAIAADGGQSGHLRAWIWCAVAAGLLALAAALWPVGRLAAATQAATAIAVAASVALRGQAVAGTLARGLWLTAPVACLLAETRAQREPAAVPLDDQLAAQMLAWVACAAWLAGYAISLLTVLRS
ncbi:MAG: hypothetical protein HZB16_13075 [Armatimonadetes bacterium]|nr:hypothetical protein [Armatimonadota bacterium]